MPVTFSVASHPANVVRIGYLADNGLTGEQILARACRAQHKEVDKVLQFAVAGSNGSGRDFETTHPNLLPQHNGFVHTVITAYNEHHALVIRPDDVWLAILCQFNFFVNANAELLRASFVAHEGKQELLIVAEGTRNDLDFGAMARQMADLVDKNVTDPALRAWALPAFSTTTATDTTAAAVLLMATLKEYFSYGFGGICCGIPRVTLDGEQSDWEDILGRLEKLKEYGVETVAWYHLLRPVIARFVAAFDAPESPENVDFWGKVAHYQRGGSGPSYYSGWINAFNVFSKKGVWLGHSLDTTIPSATAPESLSAEAFWATYGTRSVAPARRPRAAPLELVLDGAPFHRLNTNSVPPGYAEVDVALDDNGTKFACAMIAGSVGMRVTSSGDAALSADGRDDTVRPVAAWWIYTKKAAGEGQ
ncbi:hypothetical protein FB451DRAFT_95138 [Mycena latifolia]|nr:hypothetical protein FB451DRAFT_95138 [Mycena latifolia]